MKTSHKVLIVSDAQIPYHDERAVAVVQEFAQGWKPDEIIYNGDMLDFAQLTNKFSRRRTEETNLHDDITAFSLLDAGFRSAVPGARRSFLPGNHEARLETLVLERADGLEALLKHELSLSHLLRSCRGLTVVGNYLAGTAYWERGGLVVTHGDVTDLSLVARDYGSAIIGHTHREQVYSYSSRVGERRVPHKVISTGTLCNTYGLRVPPKSRKTDIANWTQGFACVWFDAEGYTAVPITIIDGSFIGPDGRRYG